MKKIITFFNMAFPKAGIKISGIPLYFSLLYLLYIPGLFFKFICSARNKTFKCLILFFLSIAFSLFFQFIFFSFQINNFIIYFQYIIPLFSILCFFWFNNYSDIKKYEKIIIISFIIISAYGLMQKIFGDYNLVIPGLTANYNEATTLNFLKRKCNFIRSLDYLKLISTYQNGNLFGVNFILLFWVFFSLTVKKNSFWIKSIVFFLYVLICILTASTTAYFGCLFSFILYFGVNFKNQFKFFIKKTLFSFLIFLLFFSFTFYYFSLEGLLHERLFARDLIDGAGRLGKILSFFNNVSSHPLSLFIGNINPDKPVYEVTPIAIIQVIGIFPLLFLCRFFYLAVKPIAKETSAIGVVSYLFMSCADGAFWLPPTAFNLFLIIGYLNLKKTTVSLPNTES